MATKHKLRFIYWIVPTVLGKLGTTMENKKVLKILKTKKRTENFFTILKMAIYERMVTLKMISLLTPIFPITKTEKLKKKETIKRVSETGNGLSTTLTAQ